MKTIVKSFIFLILQPAFAGFLYAQAPVIDDSDNYALVEGQHFSTTEYPLAKSQINEEPAETLQPLAHDDAPEQGELHSTSDEKVRMLQQEIQELRGQLEVQSHDIKILQQQLLSYYKDLDARIVKLDPSNSTSLSAANLTVASKPADSSNPADEQIRYLAAYDLVKNKRYDDAITALQDFIIQYPQGGYTANAHYWLGEIFLYKRDNERAVREFDTVLQRFPTSSKVSHSELKLAYAYIALNQKSQARALLKNVIQTYPDTAPARLAQKQLESL